MPNFAVCAGSGANCYAYLIVTAGTKAEAATKFEALCDEITKEERNAIGTDLGEDYYGYRFENDEIASGDADEDSKEYDEFNRLTGGGVSTYPQSTAEGVVLKTIDMRSKHFAQAECIGAGGNG